MSVNFISQTEQELILKAKHSNCSDELTKLSRNQFSNVRRCVAKNSKTPKHVVEELLFDPVANVSYIASINSLAIDLRRDIDISNKCVTCKKDESSFIHACRACML